MALAGNPHNNCGAIQCSRIYSIAFVFDPFAVKMIVWRILVKGDLQLLLLSTSGMSLCAHTWKVRRWRGGKLVAAGLASSRAWTVHKCGS
jgi:hypothetical protein